MYDIVAFLMTIYIVNVWTNQLYIVTYIWRVVHAYLLNNIEDIRKMINSLSF